MHEITEQLPPIPEGEQASAGVAIERRRYERLSYVTPVRLHFGGRGASSPPQEGRLRDISAGGLCVVLPHARPGALGSIIEGTICLEMIEAEEADINLHFGVQWKRSEPDGSLLFGVCFDTLLADPAATISRCSLVVVRL